MKHTKRELLPVGKKINHDGSSLEIVKPLKAGLTGEVYEGNLFLGDNNKPVRVAVKAMKTLEFPAAKQFFLQESETLAFLMHLEEEANREQGLNLKIAPIYYGRGEYHENPYLVMEFIEGKEIPDLLKDLDGGKFSEQQALTAAWHLYRTLDVLHRLLRKTYIDLKFENLWWIDSAGQLKLTDFGTLEEIQKGDTQRRGVLRDLLLAGVYFCKMATGYTPNYSLGELKEFGELKKNIKNANISWGARRELKRLLHRNSAQRPVDANDVAARLRTLVDFWSRDEEKVLEIARKSLERAQSAYDKASTQNKPISEDDLNFAYRARSAFEIISLRSPDLDTSFDKERLDTILKSADHLERGKNLLRGRSYSLAKQVFQEGMEWGEDSAALRRWAYLAEIGESISPTDFETIQDKAFAILDDLFAKEAWDESLGQLKKIQDVLDLKNIPAGLNSLFSEVHLFSEIKKSDVFFENGDFQSAAKGYRDASMYLGELPDFYQKFIRGNELGDLEKNANEIEEIISNNLQKTEIDTGYDQAIEYVEKGKDKEALDLTRKIYRASCAFGYHPERLREVIYAALEKYNYQLAFDSAQIALLGTNILQILKDDLTLAKNLNHASQSLSIPDPEQFKNALDAIETSNSLAKGCINDLLGKAEKKAKTTEDAEMYLKIGELSEKFGDAKYASDLKSKSESIAKKKSESRHKQVDVLLAEAAAFAPNPSDGVSGHQWGPYSITIIRNEDKYKYILGILTRAEIIARVDEYRLSDIARDKNLLIDKVNHLAGGSLDQKKQYEDDLFTLNRWWFEIEPLFQWRERSRGILKDSNAGQSIHEQLYGEITDFLVACYAVLQNGKRTERFNERTYEHLAESVQENQIMLEGEFTEILVLIENAYKVLNSLGPDAWRAIKQEADKAIQKTVILLTEANKSFEEGDLSRTQVLLDQSKSLSGGTQEWNILYTKTIHVALWKKWQEDQLENLSSSLYKIDILKTIRAYNEQKMPLDYWQGSPADVYLKRMDAEFQSRMTIGLPEYKSDNFVEMTKAWLDVSWTSQLVLLNELTYSSWSAKTLLDGLYSAVASKNAALITSLIRKAPIPEKIDNALASINLSAWSDIIQQKDRAHKDAEAADKKNKRIALILSSAALFLCVVLGIVGFLTREIITQQVYGTHTPTSTPTATATLTFTPTLTFTSTATLTPTPIAPSIYMIPDLNTVRPAIPVSAESALVIKPENAKMIPDISDTAIWTKETSVDPNTKGEIYYSTQKSVRLFWETDPLSGGWYTVYILDTKSKSGGLAPQPFGIFSNRQPVMPFRGQPSVIFNAESQGQKIDEWLSLGVYEILAGQTMQIRTDVPALSGDARFALSKLLIVKITSSQKSFYDSLPSERVLFNLTDDTSAIVLNTENKTPLNPEYQGLSVVNLGQSSWGGSFRLLNVDLLKGISNKVSVQWHSAGRVPAGKYQMMIWLPEGGTAVGEFSMFLNDKPIDKQTLPIINQADHPGQWWVVDVWNLPEEGTVNILFTVDAATNAGKTIGIDALALVMMK